MENFIRENETSYIEDAIFIIWFNGRVHYIDGGYEYGIRGNDHNMMFSYFKTEPKELDDQYCMAIITPECKSILCSEYNFTKLKEYLKPLLDEGFIHEDW